MNYNDVHTYDRYTYAYNQRDLGWLTLFRLRQVEGVWESGSICKRCIYQNDSIKMLSSVV